MRRTYQVGDSGYFGSGTIGDLGLLGTVVEVFENTIAVRLGSGGVRVFEKEEEFSFNKQFSPGDLVKALSEGKEIVGVLTRFEPRDGMWRIETANSRYAYPPNLLSKATWDDLRRYLDAQAVLTEVPL